MATLPRLQADAVSTTSSSRWRSSGPGPIVGQMVHPYLNRRAGREPVRYRASVARADPEAHARRAAVPGAAAAHGDGGRRLHRRPGRRAAPRDGLQAIREADEADRSAAARGHGAATASPATPPSRSSLSITSFALYGFPESHAASFALLAYASAYLKVHYPAAFYTALLNNQPMGFYHPATLVKDAQRRGVRFHPIDVQVSDWDCTVEADGAHPPRPALRATACGRRSGSAIAQPSLRVARPRRLPSSGPPCPSLRRVVSQVRLRRSVDARSRRRRSVVLQHLLARLDRRGAAAGRPLRLARRSRRAHRPAPRRAVDARRHRRAERVRLRPPLGAVAGRARRPPGGRAVQTIDTQSTQRPQRLFSKQETPRSLRALRECRDTTTCPLQPDDRSRAAGRRLRRHGPDRSAAIRWRCGATSWRCAACCAPSICRGAAGPPRARGRHGDHAPAAGHGQRASSSSRSRTKPASPTSSSGPICSRAIGWSSSRSRS